MKKSGRQININIHLSNRLAYTLIAVGILAIIGVGVYALAPGVIPNPGHNISQMSVPSPCVSGQFLSYNGQDWVCMNIPTPAPISGVLYGWAFKNKNLLCTNFYAPFQAGCNCPAGYTIVFTGSDPVGYYYACYKN
jgi:hypothetical protein